MYLVADIEATCFEQFNVRDNNEIIEVGLVVCSSSGNIQSTFQSFVRPVISQRLSGFCKKLTKIKQEWVDEAETLDRVIERAMQWLKESGVPEPNRIRWTSFGSWDNQCLIRDCHRHNIWTPFGHFTDLKKAYARYSGCKLCGLREAIENEGLIWDGQPHRAVWDAINAAKISKLVLPMIMDSAPLRRPDSSSEPNDVPST